jgi:hypothetical protein
MDNIWERCQITNKEYTTARGFLNHLRALKMSSKEYYDRFHKSNDEGICYCGCETRYHGFSYNRYCSDKCALQSEEHREAVRTRFIRNSNTLDSFRKKRKEANIDWSVAIDKRNKTIEDKVNTLGIDKNSYFSDHSKNAFSNLTPEQITERTLKMMSTKERTGNFGGRSGYKNYPFFDTHVSIQGYEPIVLDELIARGLTKEDIMIGKSQIPVISYGNNKKYFPDMYLPKVNLLIEVKSEYTLAQHYDNVMAKCDASIKAGYSILLLVLSKHEARNRKLDGSKKLLDWAISSQASKPTWYGEGSTTIRNGVGSSDPKCSSTKELVGDIV